MAANQEKESWAEVGKGMLLMGGIIVGIAAAIKYSGEQPTKELLEARERNRAGRPLTLEQIVFGG